MQAVILAGGEGTRLRPLTLTRPKPAIPLVDRPFIRYVIDWVVAHGADEVLIACGFGADAVRDSLARFGAPAVEITYLEEAQPLGTAGPLGLAADQGLLEDRFLCLNGDVLADLDLGALIRSHAEHGGVASIALHPVEDPSSYGLVRRAGGPSAPGAAPSTAEGEVEEFLEKPDPEHIDTDEVSAGAYVLEREIVEWSFRAWWAGACTVTGWRATGWTSAPPSATCRQPGIFSKAGCEPRPGRGSTRPGSWLPRGRASIRRPRSGPPR